MMSRWTTKQKAKLVIRNMFKETPKGWFPYKILIANDVPKPFDSYQGVDIEYCSALPKNQILLVDEAHYKLLVSSVCKN